MKFLLSLLGSFAISTSGGVGVALAVKNEPFVQEIEPQILESEISYQFNKFQESYYALSQTEKINLALELETIPTLNDKKEKVSSIAWLIRYLIESNFKTTLEEIENEIKDVLDKVISIMEITKEVIDIFNTILPGVVWFFIKAVFEPIANQMINVDENQKGVYIQFQQFVIPLGFKPR